MRGYDSHQCERVTVHLRPKRFRQNRIVSWLTSIPRSSRRSSTLRSDGGKVTGCGWLRLRVGSSNRTAGYLRGTDTEELVFGYEVDDGHEDTDGVSIEAGRITLNGGTIKDEADNPAELAHEAVAAQVGHKVDGVRPVFVSAAVDGSSLTLTYGETLDGGSRPAPGDFTVEVDGAGRSVTGVSVSGSVVTLTLSTAVEHGDTGIRVSTPAGKLELVQSNGETVQCALILMSEWKAKLPDYL